MNIEVIKCFYCGTYEQANIDEKTINREQACSKCYELPVVAVQKADERDARKKGYGYK